MPTVPTEGEAMTATDRTPARLLAIFGLAGVILLAGCGGAATPTAAPTAVPTTAPTPAPTAAPATPAPTAAPATAAPTIAPADSPAATKDPALGGFAFPAAQILAYYGSNGLKCGDPTPSTQAAGYTITRCVGTDDTTKLTTIVAVVTDPEGVMGDAFVGVLGSDGKTMPKPEDAITGLGFFLGATLGETDGTAAVTWLAQHMGEEMAQTTINDMVVATYPGDEATGLGYYVETANQAFLNAPTP
jgi:hypothetical protein